MTFAFLAIGSFLPRDASSRSLASDLGFMKETQRDGRFFKWSAT
jgi:hypothetical protein